MRPEYRARWEHEAALAGEHPKKPEELLRRRLSDEDYIDGAVIGGVDITDVIAGKVSEAQIPHDVLEAFHFQYPRQQGFVEAVQHLSGDPEALRGLINGVKGKLFEVHYVDWLNAGHLPDGVTATLAHSASQPAWDIVIRGPDGRFEELLQLKATASVEYVKSAIDLHPYIDVVATHEVYERLSKLPLYAEHVIDGHRTLDDLTHHVQAAASHVHTAADHFHVPGVAIALAAAQNFSSYRKSHRSLEEAFGNFGERSIMAVVANAAGWGAAAVTHSTGVGIPVAVATRVFIGQAKHNIRRRKVLDELIVTITESRAVMARQLPRPLFFLPAADEF
jgi:hypothetical protein